jgi:hypothetical protein
MVPLIWAAQVVWAKVPTRAIATVNFKNVLFIRIHFSLSSINASRFNACNIEWKAL